MAMVRQAHHSHSLASEISQWALTSEASSPGPKRKRDVICGQSLRSVDLRVLNPEPWLLLTTYWVGDVTSGKFQHNPYGVYLQPEPDLPAEASMKFMPSRIAKKPWPAFFDYECCDTQGITVVEAEPDALYFNLTDDIMKLKEEQTIHGKLAIAFDWVSVRHFLVTKCGAENDWFCIYHIDDAEHKAASENFFQIYASKQRIHQALYNPMSSVLIWSEEILDSSSFQLKFRFKDEKEQDLAAKCPCMSDFAVTYPAITFDWRSYHEDNGTTEPGVLFVANDTLWRLNSVLNQCTCTQLIPEIHDLTLNETVVRITSDWSYFYWLEDSGLLYAYNWKTEDTNEIWTETHQKWRGMVTQMKAVGAEFRPFSPEKCYFPTSTNVSINMTSFNKGVLSVDLHWDDSDLCKNIPKPPVDVIVNYTIVDHQLDPQKVTCTSDLKCKMLKETWSRKSQFRFPVDGLTHNKTYFVQTIVFPTNQYPEGFKPYLREPEIVKYKLESKYEPEIRVPTGAIVGSVAVIAILLIVLAVLLALYFKKWHRYIEIPRVWPHQLTRIKNFDSSKMRDHDVRLGGGQFGDVYLEKYKGKLLVATKVLKENSTDYDEKCFVDEILLMWMGRGPHIVELLGICLTTRPYRFIMEYVEGTTLHKHLEKLAREKYGQMSLTQLSADDERDILKALGDAAKACDRLDKLCILHRDIAARNLLVEYNKGTGRIDKVKLTDFGLAKEVGKDSKTYTIPHGKVRELPFRLFAIECLEKSEFSPKSEVWEFGILIWEVFTLGASPYSSLEPFREDSFQAVLNFLKSGQRLPRPKYCENERYNNLWNLVLSCWDAEPLQRPTINDVGGKIEELAKQLSRPIHKVLPLLTNRSNSERPGAVQVRHDVGGPVSSSVGAQRAVGSPSIAYEDKILPPMQPVAEVGPEIEMQESAHLMPVARGYKNAERMLPRMTDAYTTVRTTDTSSDLTESQESQISSLNTAESEDTKTEAVELDADYSRPIQLTKK